MSSSSGGGRTSYKDQIHVEGDLGTKTYRRGDEPEVGGGEIAYVAVFTGVVDFENDAIIGPVSVGSTKANSFKDSVEDRLRDAEFRDFKES